MWMCIHMCVYIICWNKRCCECTCIHVTYILHTYGYTYICIFINYDTMTKHMHAQMHKVCHCTHQAWIGGNLAFPIPICWLSTISTDHSWLTLDGCFGWFMWLLDYASFMMVGWWLTDRTSPSSPSCLLMHRIWQRSPPALHHLVQSSQVGQVGSVNKVSIPWHHYHPTWPSLASPFCLV